MTDSRYLVDQIAPIVEAALTKHDAGDDPSWMAGMFVMPSPDGQAAMNGYLSVSIPSPIIGAAAPTATAILDPRILLDEGECDRLITELLMRAREMRSQQIFDARTEFESGFDFSQLPRS